jgi:RNA polymerase sigma factor (sigma-70 family)
MTSDSRSLLRRRERRVFAWTPRLEQIARDAADGYFYPCSDDGDVVQEARYGVWKAWRDWEPGRGPFEPFARRRARGQVIDGLRLAQAVKHRALNEAVSLDAPIDGDDSKICLGDLIIREDGDPVYIVIARDELARLIECITALTPWQRECVVRVLIAGEPYGAVGRQKSVDNALCLGRRKLKESWANVA